MYIGKLKLQGPLPLQAADKLPCMLVCGTACHCPVSGSFTSARLSCVSHVHCRTQRSQRLRIALSIDRLLRRGRFADQLDI